MGLRTEANVALPDVFRDPFESFLHSIDITSRVFRSFLPVTFDTLPARVEAAEVSGVLEKRCKDAVRY
jgi:hypothetical protein